MSRRKKRSTNKAGQQHQDFAVDISAVNTIGFEFASKTKCYICNNVEDEDLTVLCDGPGCNKEAHMYCLDPILTEVPEGDWLCDYCDELGTSRQLTQYFHNFNKECTIPCNPAYYKDWVGCLQARYTPSHQWKTALHSDVVRESEFNPADSELVGLCVSLLIDEEASRYHTGRIINSRECRSTAGRREHLVQFKRYAVMVKCNPTSKL